MTSKSKSLFKNENVQTLIVVGLVLILVFGFWFGAQVALHTEIPPALAVVSGSMCIPYDGACDGWLSVNHPFARTLHKGDIIIIQGVDPSTLNTNYPDSDIIVFHSPYNNDELIVHRIIGTTQVNGVTYFLTKGDGNGNPWPEQPRAGLDPWDNRNPAGVSPDQIVGKVILRIPWVGWVAIFMQWVQERLNIGNANLAIPIIVVLIIALIIIEFGGAIFKRRKGPETNTKPEGSTLN
jgi:hypothetical protein